MKILENNLTYEIIGNHLLSPGKTPEFLKLNLQLKTCSLTLIHAFRVGRTDNITVKTRFWKFGSDKRLEFDVAKINDINELDIKFILFVCEKFNVVLRGRVIFETNKKDTITIDLNTKDKVYKLTKETHLTLDDVDNGKYEIGEDGFVKIDYEE